LGGYDDNLDYKNDVWKSSDGVTWIKVVDNPPWTPRRAHQVISHGGYLWVLGGDGTGGMTSDVWRSSDGDNWIEVTPKAKWAARFDHNTISYDG
jgi:hypothetical protein